MASQNSLNKSSQTQINAKIITQKHKKTHVIDKALIICLNILSNTNSKTGQKGLQQWNLTI